MAGSGRKLVLDLLGWVRFHVRYLFFLSGEGVKEDLSSQHEAMDDVAELGHIAMSSHLARQVGLSVDGVGHARTGGSESH